MTDLSALLDAAERAPKPSRTVKVCVIPSVAVERAGLLEALAQAEREDARDESADQRLGAEPQPVTVRQDAARKALEAFDKKAQKALVRLKFTRMDGSAWTRLTSANPMRIDVALDRQFGYDYDTVSELAARATGVILTDKGEQPVFDEDWDRLFRVLSGHDVEAIRDAVWTLNEWEPGQHIEALVKDSGAA